MLPQKVRFKYNHTAPSLGVVQGIANLALLFVRIQILSFRSIQKEKNVPHYSDASLKNKAAKRNRILRDAPI